MAAIPAHVELPPRVEDVYGVYQYAQLVVELFPADFNFTPGLTVTETPDGFTASAGSSSVCVKVLHPGDCGDWEYRRDTWMKAVLAAPHIETTRRAEWHSIASLPPAEVALAQEAVVPHEGDPVAMCAEEEGRMAMGAYIIDKTFEGAVRVQPAGTAGAKDRPPEVIVKPDHLGKLPNWPLLGVSLKCLRSFAGAHAAQIVGATTEDVCDWIIKPLTAQPKASAAVSGPVPLPHQRISRTSTFQLPILAATSKLAGLPVGQTSGGRGWSPAGCPPNGLRLARSEVPLRGPARRT